MERSLQSVLGRALRPPLYLTPQEVDGRWQDLFPELAKALPVPYPIFSPDEDRVLDHGYPVEITGAFMDLRRHLAGHVEAEVERILGAHPEGPDNGGACGSLRGTTLQLFTGVMENAMLSDFGRGIFSILVLVLTRETAELVKDVPKLVARRDVAVARRRGEAIRFATARIFGGLLEQAEREAAGRIRALADVDAQPRRSTLLAVAVGDLLPLALAGPPPDPMGLRPFVDVQYRQDGDAVLRRGQMGPIRLAELFRTRPELEGAFQVAAGPLDLAGPRAFLQPKLWNAVRAMGLLHRIEMTPKQAELLVDLGLRLKRLEVIAAARRHVTEVSARGGVLTVTSRRPTLEIASSTRPLDFTRPGVVTASVRRFGLVYDLTAFTETLEEIRKRGRRAEERALQFMYIFQRRLDEIRRRRRLTFEKFLGDGAFYSSRRASRTVAAACEIQMLYDRLRSRGFPFSRGIRMAVNFGTYQLLPMMTGDDGGTRFEFFGHGVVELLRLTTGKSTREVDEIAEFLISSGYSPALVDDFLAPLAAARSGVPEGSPRPYTVRVDQRGELINEGIVLTPAVVEELAREASEVRPVVATAFGHRWVVLPLREAGSPDIAVGLRFVGMARLKGLPPLEIVEANPWPAPPAEDARTAPDQPLPSLLRGLAAPEEAPDEAPAPVVPENLAVITYLDRQQRRHWLFGLYRPADDVLLEAIETPLRPPDIEDGEPLEAWLFRNRRELSQVYAGLRRENPGLSVPLKSLRRQDGFVGTFLAAPHRSLE